MCLVFEVRASEVVNTVKVCNYLVLPIFVSFCESQFTNLQIDSHFWPMIKHYHFIWRQRCCEVFEWFNLKSNFIPAVVGVFSRDLIILLENPPIFGAASQWSGEIAIFHPHIARNCYISPSYWFSGKRFCGVRIIGIGEPIMSAQEGGMMMGAPQMDMRTT